jgi:hypothetical protein
VTTEPASCRFEARVVSGSRPPCPGDHTLRGRFGRVQDTLYAIAWLALPLERDCSLPRLRG